LSAGLKEAQSGGKMRQTAARHSLWRRGRPVHVMARPAAPALPVTAQCSAVQCSALCDSSAEENNSLLPSHAPQPARPEPTPTHAHTHTHHRPRLARPPCRPLCSPRLRCSTRTVCPSAEALASAPSASAAARAAPTAPRPGPACSSGTRRWASACECVCVRVSCECVCECVCESVCKCVAAGGFRVARGVDEGATG
jgi:hypothetical protein